ncbi:MAG TPA: hypothetical protein VFY83_11975, partial [Anaerolineales bacterium]|nr:hypothetical protein [Anaerolineales bacterium]
SFNESELFTEVNGCLLVEVAPSHASDFEELFNNLPFQKIGVVIQEPVLNIRESVSVSVLDLVHAFNNPKHR